MKYQFKIFFMVIAFSMLQACNEKQTTQKENHQHKQSSVTTQAYVKPHAPIYLSYEVPAMEIGVEASIPVKISSGKKADDLTISYFVKDESINLYNARIPVSFGVQDKNQLNTHTLTLMPEMDGEFMIYLSATTIKKGKQQSRSFIIPVRVGNVRKQKALKPSGKITIDSTGTPVISMPAVETTD
ncbi:MAG: hypothetical protein OQK76_00510 [Gammaproteobacteria bacterium]|nr:hypothetical protein [Gammaproteobacteria bacterium]MCW8909079.1 hypothetical protein [Gammaproteobacteria bacterium]MCW9004060.1 hypothetical protein [Gammaproteobacteria bacterium]MCW9055412.1 hypothetical protein [Gammaproteobacteria bacterium]